MVEREKRTIQRLIDLGSRLQDESCASYNELLMGRESCHSLVSNIPDVLWKTDWDNRIIYISENIEAITGYTQEEEYCLSRFLDWVERVHPDDVDNFVAANEALFKADMPFSIEYRMLRKDGRWVWIHGRPFAIYYENGKKYASGLMSEITGRKEAELRINELKSKYETLIKNIPVVVYSTLPDETSTMSFVSERWQEWTGFSPEDTYGEPQTWPKCVHPEDREGAARSYVEAYETRKEYFSEYRLVNRNSGEVRWILDHGIPVTDGDGRIERFDGIMLDITDRVRAQQALIEANDRLEMRVKERTAELGALSHRLVEAQETERHKVAGELHDQIGQYLTALKISLQRATRLPAQEVVAGVENAVSLVNDLMAEIRSMSLDLRPPMLDDLGLVPALLWYFKRYKEQTGIEVEFKHRVLKSKLTSAISTAAYRIVQEALTNVARHAGVTSMAVNLWARRGMLLLRVEDNGVGFRVEDLPVERSVGLQSMRERASLLGGELVISSTPGSGTCITAELPLTGAVGEGEGNDNCSTGR